MKFIAGVALASLLSMAPMVSGAQANKPTPSVTAGNSSAEPRVASDMLTRRTSRMMSNWATCMGFSMERTWTLT